MIAQNILKCSGFYEDSDRDTMLGILKSKEKMVSFDLPSGTAVGGKHACDSKRRPDSMCAHTRWPVDQIEQSPTQLWHYDATEYIKLLIHVFLASMHPLYLTPGLFDVCAPGTPPGICSTSAWYHLFLVLRVFSCAAGGLCWRSGERRGLGGSSASMSGMSGPLTASTA